jgi:aminoglycoside 3-N-acetyltransferase
MDSTPMGPNSPLSLLPRFGGKILFIGCGLKPNTSMHAVEELIEPPYLFGDFLEFNIINDGVVKRKKIRQHNFKGFEQRYDRIANLLNEKEMKKGSILAASVHLLDAEAMWEKAYMKLTENPYYFVDRLNERDN